MKKCCYDPANLSSYGAAKKTVEAHSGLLTIRYSTYLRCKVCQTRLRAEVTKNIHDRETPKAAKVVKA